MTGEVRAMHSTPAGERLPCMTLGQGPSPVHFGIEGESQQGWRRHFKKVQQPLPWNLLG